MLLKFSTCNLVIAMLELLPICLISLFAFENLTSKCVGPVCCQLKCILKYFGKKFEKCLENVDAFECRRYYSNNISLDVNRYISISSLPKIQKLRQRNGEQIT